MQLDEKIAIYKSLMREIDALEEKKKQMAQEIIAEMPDKKFETCLFKAFRYQRLLIRTSLEEARLLSATKMEERIDREKIKHMFHSGVPIEGVEEHSYLIVRAKEQPADEPDSLK